MTIKLRPYQADAVKAVRHDIASGVNRPAVVIPTGGGKTITLASLIRESDERALVLAHRTELIEQAAEALHDVMPDRTIGIVKGRLDGHTADIVVGSVATLARPERRRRIGPIGIGVVDECHHAAARTYGEVMGAYEVPWVGFTATMGRGDGKALGEIWEKVSYEVPLLWMIRNRYLVDARGIRVSVPDLDLSRMRKTAGDYREGELGERLADSLAPSTVAKAYVEHASREGGRFAPGVLFAPTVATAHLFADALKAVGVRAATVWGEMDDEDRGLAIKQYKAGDLDVLCNCGVLTEGFDSPRAEIAVIARPTASSVLYRQMVGRVLRLSPGKTVATVLDVVGASEKHDLCGLATLLGDHGVEEVRDGETLLAALDELEEQADEGETFGYTGSTVSKSVDLFAGSRQSWLQTFGGWWFIPAGKRAITIIPSRTEGALDVVWFSLDGDDRSKGLVIKGITDLGMAMAHGEGAITQQEEIMSAREGRWRTRAHTAAQLTYARNLGMDTTQIGPEMSAGALSDLISIMLVSGKVDEPVRRRIERARVGA